jgi:hypothetical protein
MVLYYLMSRELKKIEGREFTLRMQKNSQDSVRFTDEAQVPMCLRRVEACFDGQLWEKVIAAVPCELKQMLIKSIRDTMPSNEAIKQVAQNGIPVPGAEVYRGNHLRVA